MIKVDILLCKSCENKFKPIRKGHLFCSKKCRGMAYRKNNKIKIIKKMKLWHIKNKQHVLEYNRLQRLQFPWRYKLASIKTRCTNKKEPVYKYYGGRGILCLLTESDLKNMWIRDQAFLMERPSIDRIDNDGNYEFSNCRFIESTENISKRWKDKTLRDANRKITI